MRDLTTATIAKAVLSSGTAPMVIIKIEWGGAIGDKYYADADVTVGAITALGRVLAADIDGIAATGGAGTVQEGTISLVDPDGTLRGYTNQAVLDGKAVTIYHNYDGLAEVDFVELLAGIVRGPIQWGDNNRVLSFRVERGLVDAAITYTPESGEVADLPEESEGVAWPTCFGTVIDVPAVRVQRGPRGTLKEAISIHNSAFVVTDGADFPQLSEITITVGGVYCTGEFDGEDFTVSEWNVPKYTSVIPGPRVIGDDDEDSQFVFWLQDPTQEVLGLTLVLQSSSGMDAARTSNTVVAQQGNKCWCAYPWGVLCNNTSAKFVAHALAREQSPRVMLWFIKAGAAVRQVAQADIYVANDAESTELLRVQAWQQQTDDQGVATTALVPVPSNFYTTNLADSIGGRTVTSITFAVPLSDRDAAWQDTNIFVSLRSSLSSNPATAIEWMLTERAGYSSGDLDTAAFAAAETALTKYPSHFALLESRTVSSLQEFAEQSRCALTWQNGLWHIRYLSAEPAEDDTAATLDDGWITEGAIGITATNREESDRFATRMVGTYRSSYAFDADRVMLENTTAQALYGVMESGVDFWGLQSTKCVAKTLEFMLARRSRVWKLAQLATQLNALAVEIYDYITLDVTDLWPADLQALVMDAAHNTAAHEITLNLWLPIEEGASTVSDDAYLDDSSDTPPPDPGAGITEGNPEVLQCSYFSTLLMRDGIEDESETSSVPGIVQAQVTTTNYSVTLYPDGLDDPAGDTVTARALDGAEPDAGVEVMCSRVSGQWYLEYSGAGAAMQQFRVKSVAADYIACRTWDGTTEGGTDVFVAKSYLLRRSFFDNTTHDGITYVYSSPISRTANDGTITKTQTIDPPFVVDDTIYGIRGINGSVGVTDVEWLDINADGRTWEKPSTDVQQFRVKSVAGDYIVCRTWDGTTDGDTDISVARPYLLRRTPFDGGSRAGIDYTYSSDIEREADDGEDTETQVIVPSYVVNDIVYGIRGVNGGVVVADVEWLDLNADGRAWAKQDES